MTRNFMQLLQAQQDKGNFVCVGLDSDVKKLPKHLVEEQSVFGAQLEFNKLIIDATKDFAGAYKPNLAFYKGPAGKEVLRKTIAYINDVAPDIPVILDAKYGDIGNTNDGYVDDVEIYGADAVTIHNYMGMEAMKPFLDQSDKGVIVLCRTSNPGAGFIQDRHVVIENYALAEHLGIGSAISFYMNGGGDASGRVPTIPHYELIAYDVAVNWNYNNNVCVVVGTTAEAVAKLAQVRHIVGDMPILLPGIGAQGGDLEATVDAGKNSKNQGMIINNSRGIIFAYQKDEEFGAKEFASAARKAGLAMHNAIRSHLGLEITTTV